MTNRDEYPYIPPKCRKGECYHNGPCYRSRSYRCVSGECSCATKGLACAVSITPAEKTTA